MPEAVFFTVILDQLRVRVFGSANYEVRLLPAAAVRCRICVTQGQKQETMSSISFLIFDRLGGKRNSREEMQFKLKTDK